MWNFGRSSEAEIGIVFGAVHPQAHNFESYATSNARVAAPNLWLRTPPGSGIDVSCPADLELFSPSKLASLVISAKQGKLSFRGTDTLLYCQKIASGAPGQNCASGHAERCTPYSVLRMQCMYGVRSTDYTVLECTEYVRHPTRAEVGGPRCQVVHLLIDHLFPPPRPLLLLPASHAPHA